MRNQDSQPPQLWPPDLAHRGAVFALLLALVVGLLLSTGSAHAQGTTIGICDRTQAVQDALLAQIVGVTACADAHLAAT